MQGSARRTTDADIRAENVARRSARSASTEPVFTQNLVILYAWLLRRRKKVTLRFASLALVKQAVGKSIGWRRHVPPVLLLAGFAALVVSAARPMAVIQLPTQQQTIILAMDVSGSMRATDVAPDRISASQVGAKAFVSELPRNVRIGVVAYAGTAQLVQPPTLSRDDVTAAIDRFQLQRGTAIGSGIVISLATIFPDAGIDLSNINGQRLMPRATPLGGAARPAPPEFTRLETGLRRTQEPARVRKARDRGHGAVRRPCRAVHAGGRWIVGVVVRQSCVSSRRRRGTLLVSFAYNQRALRNR
ncbi:VWA domain-containing protein [Hydrogenophaga sp. A37]